MGKKVGELFVTEFMRLEFEYDKERLKQDMLIIRASWWNKQYGEWEELQEIFLPMNKIDEIVEILLKAKECH